MDNRRMDVTFPPAGFRPNVVNTLLAVSTMKCLFFILLIVALIFTQFFLRWVGAYVAGGKQLQTNRTLTLHSSTSNRGSNLLGYFL